MVQDKAQSRIALSAIAVRLSDEHFAEVVEGSGVDPELLEGRYRTVTTEEARAVGFSERQARDGLLTTLYSPTGEVHYALKPDKPRTEVKKNGKHKIEKYETQRTRAPTVVDVHPSLRRRLLVSEEPLYVTEGAKKADCLASRNRLAVEIFGVGSRRDRPELLPDWDAVPLEGRRVYLAFDADFRKKRKVAQAIVRLAERLTERGAHVYIIWLPGPEKGIDDFVVAGGDLERLEEGATFYQACDFIPYLPKDSKVMRKAVARTERRLSLSSLLRYLAWWCKSRFFFSRAR